jgi:hypothetical protein
MNLTPSPITSDWLNIQQTIKAYPIGRTTLFDIVRRGCIKSAVLRSPGSLKGRRLIHRPSLDEYLLKLAAEETELVSR